MRLLVTRPEPDNARTAERLSARNHEVLLAPLLRVEYLAADLGNGPWSAVALTSANAARAAGRHPRRAEFLPLPLYAVGRQTSAAARAEGFANVIPADGDESALVELIATRPCGGPPVLYLAGEDRARDLVADLSIRGIAADLAVVYRAAAATAFPPGVRRALKTGRLDAVLHYSRRSAAIYLDCAAAAGLLDAALAPWHYCLSRQVAEPLAAAGARTIRIAARPDEAALLELIVS